jgi:hypothetical protein
MLFLGVDPGVVGERAALGAFERHFWTCRHNHPQT